MKFYDKFARKMTLVCLINTHLHTFADEKSFYLVFESFCNWFLSLVLSFTSYNFIELKMDNFDVAIARVKSLATVYRLTNALMHVLLLFYEAQKLLLVWNWHFALMPLCFNQQTFFFPSLFLFLSLLCFFTLPLAFLLPWWEIFIEFRSWRIFESTLTLLMITTSCNKLDKIFTNIKRGREEKLSSSLLMLLLLLFLLSRKSIILNYEGKNFLHWEGGES